MIHINKDYKVPDKLLNAQKNAEKELIRLQKKFGWGTEHYSVPIKEDLCQLYNDKCAFCEAKLVFSSSNSNEAFTIEHYRPKSSSKDIIPCYWWLGNEWTNLFPTCKRCNGAKEDFFPLFFEKKRVTQPLYSSDSSLDRESCKANNSYLLDEQPLFIHPEVDEPEKYFIFLPDGKIEIEQNLSTYELERARSMKTKFLGVEYISLKRKKHIEWFKSDLENRVVEMGKICGDELPTDKEIKLTFNSFFKNLLIAADPISAFSRLGYYMLYSFESFFLENYPTTIKELLKRAFFLFFDTEQNYTK